MRGALIIVLVCGCSFQSPGAVTDAGDGGPDIDAPDAGPIVPPCDPLPRDGTIVSVDNVAALRTAITSTTSGAIELANGTYALNPGGGLVMINPGVTLRSASGDASMVILDNTGGGAALQIQASDVTVTALTIKGGTGVVVEPTAAGSITGVVFHDVTFIDAFGTALSLRAAGGNNAAGPYADNGTVACSRFQLTVTTPCAIGALAVLGLDGDGIRDWKIHDNRFEDLACSNKVARAARLRGGSRDVLVANNTFENTTLALMMGFLAGTTVRAYPDPLGGCIATPEMRGGIACNNVIAGLDVPTIAASQDFQGGIVLWNACDTTVIHNTIVSPAGTETLGSLEYRFAGTVVHLVNNLIQRAPLKREGNPVADHLPSNVIYTSPSDFVDPRTDLHLTAGATVAPGESITSLGMCGADAEGKPRNLATPTVGAYER